MSKQTAVEWLVKIYLQKGKIDNFDMEQAKAMEKEQIIKSFEIGYENGACVNEENIFYHGGNYYNETYKGGEE